MRTGKCENGGTASSSGAGVWINQWETGILGGDSEVMFRGFMPSEKNHDTARLMRRNIFHGINIILMLCISAIVIMTIMLVQERTLGNSKALSDSNKWNQLLLASEVGRWKWYPAKDVLIWDEACKRLYGIKDASWVPSYEGFANTIDPHDLGWVNEIVRKTLEDRSSYRAVFKLKNGSYIRAYGKVITKDDGEIVFAGVCLPATVQEYTGTPLVSLNLNSSE